MSHERGLLGGSSHGANRQEKAKDSIFGSSAGAAYAGGPLRKRRRIVSRAIVWLWLANICSGELQ